jgi:hypothetical protein
MRMWMVDPATMCDRHLLGEHAEIHMAIGTIAKGRSVAGRVEHGLLEPASFRTRHDALAAEMVGRGFRHDSPLPDYDLSGLPAEVREHRVDVAAAERELRSRCRRCGPRADG